MARQTAEHYRAIIEDTREFLVVLAELPAIRSVDPSRGASILGKLLRDYPLYSNLGVVAPDGNVVCSAVPLKEPVSVADGQWFQQAMKTRDLAVGEYRLNAFGSYPLLDFGYPIIGSDDRPLEVVFATLDIAYLVRQMSFVLPAESTELAVVNHNGVILGQTGGREDRIGRTTPEASLIKEASVKRSAGQASCSILQASSASAHFVRLAAGGRVLTSTRRRACPRPSHLPAPIGS